MGQDQSIDNNNSANKRDFDLELDRLEGAIEQLRIQYEQYFCDVFPQPPEKLRSEVLFMIRQLLKAPFKNSADRFRLRSITQRFQTYSTYWERVIKQREDGTYMKDVFKVELRERLQSELQNRNHLSNNAEKGIRGLYESYETALKNAGKKPDNLNYDIFKKSLLKKVKELKEQQGVKKIQYKVVIKDGKVLLKASAKS
jgi:hypothetical protein